MKKLKILINAYACSPNMGSEQGMAWNWCIHLAQYSELFIITEEEYRNEIEKALEVHEFKENLHFYYIPVTEKVRRMCRNQGDWRFYFFYEKWQRKVLTTARQIISEHKIDILHQLNMIGFREPGYLWKIDQIPFVWGPIGGLNQFPVSYLDGAKISMKIFFHLKNILNKIQFKNSIRINKAIKHADYLISATPESYEAFKKYKNKESVHIPDQGAFMHKINDSHNRFHSDTLQVIWVGKFDFRKQLNLAIKTIAATQNKKIILNVYGQGSIPQEKEIKSLINNLNISNQIIFHGNQPNSKIQRIMQKSDLFFFTSLSEGTPTVIMEAISNQLPILCFDACGFGAIVNESIGIKLPFTDPNQSIHDFAKHLNILFYNRGLLNKFSKNCEFLQHKFSWDANSRHVTKLYQELTALSI